MPARFRDIIRAAQKQGVRCEEPSSGSHWKMFKGEKMYPIPAHNGERSEITDQYIRTMCRQLGLDESQLRKAL